MRTKGKRLTSGDRQVIKTMLTHENSCKDIADSIGCDPSSISKEIKRNRVIYKEGLNKEKCKFLERFPYTCNHCVLRYNSSSCKLTKYIYDNEKAQTKYEVLKVKSRVGIDTTKDEFMVIDKLIKEGVDNKEGIYHIVITHDEINVSIPTIYRWISKGYMTTKRLDLPYCVSYKPRKKDNKKYDYSAKNNKIDRSNRTFIDYLKFRILFPGSYASQIDFLGTIKTDTNDILTLIIPELHFPILKLFENPDELKLKMFLDELELALGSEMFYKIFPAILGDRDPIFNDYIGIETSIQGGDNIRTQMFYCDPYVSTQKPFIENLNKQLRLYFPKGKSIDIYNEDVIKKINRKLVERKVASLGGESPKDVFIKIFGEEAFNNLAKIIF